MGRRHRYSVRVRGLNKKLFKIQRLLRQEGDHGLSGRVSPKDASALAKEYLGPNFRQSRTYNDVYISADGLRQVRGPNLKYGQSEGTGQFYSNTNIQMNFQARTAPSGPYRRNVHLDVGN